MSRSPHAPHRPGARLAALAGLVGLIGSSAVVALGAAPADAATSSPYNFQAHAYGSKISGGSIPATSGKSAYSPVGCTSVAGRHKSNALVGIDAGPLQVGAVTTSSRSYRSGSTYNALSSSAVASVDAGSGGGPSLAIRSLSSTSHSWHSSSGYHSTMKSTGLISLTAAPGVPAVSLPFPAPGQTLALPGLGSLTAGQQILHRGANFASAKGYALVLKLTATGSTVRLGYAQSLVQKAVPAGIFSGSAFGSRASLVNGLVGSGRTGYITIPCTGTDNKVKTTNTAGVTIPGVLSLGATKSAIRAGASGSTRKTGDARSESTVATVVLGNQVTIKAIRAFAHVHRTKGGKLTGDTNGTTPGSLTYGGTTTPLPTHGTYTVPGLLSIQTGLVTKTTTSRSVIAVRVTLLSGTAANSVIDLGNATARIAKR